MNNEPMQVGDLVMPLYMQWSDEGSSVEDWQYLAVERRGNVFEHGG